MLVSGSTEDMELVDLTTKQSCILPFPLKWTQGGLISETKAHLCNFQTSATLKCVLLNLSTLKTTFSDVTVSKVARTNSVMLNGQIASTGGRIDNSHSQITDQVNANDMAILGHQFQVNIARKSPLKVLSNLILRTGFEEGQKVSLLWYI